MPLRLRHRPTIALAVIASLALGGLSYAAVQGTTVAPRHHARHVVRRARVPRITATPRVASIDPAASARYAISVFQRRRSRRVRFVASGRLPAGARLAIVRRKRGRASARAVVIVSTTAATPAGSYRLRLTARPVRRKRRARRAASRRARSTAFVAARKTARRRRRPRALATTLTLVVRTPQPVPAGTLQVTGTLSTPLAPGAREPLDLTLASDHPFALTVSTISVEIERIDAPGAGSGSGCGTDDFRLTQYSGPPLAVAPSAATSLTAAGATTEQLPQLEMLDRPVNQDGCKGATIQLRYTAEGERAPS